MCIKGTIETALATFFGTSTFFLLVLFFSNNGVEYLEKIKNKAIDIHEKVKNKVKNIKHKRVLSKLEAEDMSQEIKDYFIQKSLNSKVKNLLAQNLDLKLSLNQSRKLQK